MKRVVVEIKRRVYVDEKTLKRVEDYLRRCESEYGVMASEVSRGLGIDPSTARKYLEVLVVMGRAEKKRVGSVVFYSIIR